MDWLETPQLGPDSRVWALGLTFADHMRETGQWADKPLVFAKPCRPILGGGVVNQPTQRAMRESIQALSPARCQRLSDAVSTWPVLLDYEVELGVVLLEDWAVGQGMPKVGYVLVNDLTARSIQIAGLGTTEVLRYWSAAKGFEGFLPMSNQMGCPATEQSDVWPDVVLRTHVNEQLRQQAPMRDVLYTPLAVLTHAARCAPQQVLRRHDVVLTGTPAGIALQVPNWKRALASCLPSMVAIRSAWRSQAASRRYLQPGDTVAVSADGFGTLTSRIQGPV